MNREEAYQLVCKHLKNRNLINHSLAVEACMRALGKYFDEDVELWGLAGLLHDLDYEYTLDQPDLHALKTVDMLNKFQLDESVLHAIKSHNMKAEFRSKMDLGLYSVDPATGFIIAVALMHPSKSLEAANLKRMKKRFKEKSFAKGASRDQIKTCEKLGIILDDFLKICRDAMSEIHTELGL